MNTYMSSITRRLESLKADLNKVDDNTPHDLSHFEETRRYYALLEAVSDSLRRLISSTFENKPETRDEFLQSLRKTDPRDFYGRGLRRSPSQIRVGIERLIKDIEEYLDIIPLPTDTTSTIPRVNSKQVFIVHGHDDEMKNNVHNFLVELGLNPIILSEQANRGLTYVMEKFEFHAQSSSFAIVLLSPDDYGYAKRHGESAKKPRARQNVILELGYFIGSLTRKRVVAFTKKDEQNQSIEQPSDIVGGIIEPFDDNWKDRIKMELVKAGFELSAQNHP